MLKTAVKSKKGQSQTNPLLLFGVLFLVGAIIVIAVFILIIYSKEKGETGHEAPAGAEEIMPTDGTDRIDQGKEQEAEAIVRKTWLAVLTEFKDNEIVVTEKNTGIRNSFALAEQTVITYNGADFQRSRFWAGDQLEIAALQTETGWLAETITVLVSASPETPAPVPPPANVRPDGSIKPL